MATTKSRFEGTARGLVGSLGSLCAAVFVALSLAGCKARRASPSMRAEPPLPAAPAELAATLSVPSVAALYAGVRALGEPRATSLPASAELGLTVGLGLPAPVASALLFDRPAAGALLVGEDGSAAIVVACRVRSGEEVALALTGGATPARRATADPKSGLTTLTASDGSALGVVGDWLVLASTPEALGSAGAYVARVLGSRPPAESALRLDVVSTAFPRLAAALGARWQATRAALATLAERARAQAGRPADYADPKLVLGFADSAVAQLSARIASSRSAAFTLELGPQRAELALELEPAPESPAAAALDLDVARPLEPLFALPRETVLGVLWRKARPPATATARASAGELANVIGSDLAANEGALLQSALALLERGVGETTVFGLLPDETAVVEGDLGDPEALDHVDQALVAVLNAPGLRAPFTALLGKTPARARSERVGPFEAPVHRVAFPEAGAGEREPELAWGVRSNEVLATFGRKGPASLSALASAAPPQTLGADPEFRAAAGRRIDASFAAMARLEPFFDAPGYAVFASGKRGAAERFELEFEGKALGFVGGSVP